MRFINNFLGEHDMNTDRIEREIAQTKDHLAYLESCLQEVQKNCNHHYNHHHYYEKCEKCKKVNVMYY